MSDPLPATDREGVPLLAPEAAAPAAASPTTLEGPGRPDGEAAAPLDPGYSVVSSSGRGAPSAFEVEPGPSAPPPAMTSIEIESDKASLLPASGEGGVPAGIYHAAEWMEFQERKTIKVGRGLSLGL